jgi:transcription termination factor Rho
LAIDRILTVEGVDIEKWETPEHFDKLTAMFPTERIIMETPKDASISARVVDLVAPLGKGQRGLICASPRSGKTMLLKEIAKSIIANHKEIELLILLLDERPEEVTDFEETVAGGQIFASTFDESPKRHSQLAELVSERAKRLVESGKDVVILLDSLTRLARGYNSLAGGKGRTMSGGMDAKALAKPKKFFGAARNVEEGGSLTILATALIETESRMDEVIFEEFKGTGNLEITLDREISERRIYPAIHVLKSGTRRDDLLYHPDEFRRVTQIRKQLAAVPAVEAIELLIKNINRTRNNAEVLLTGLK